MPPTLKHVIDQFVKSDGTTPESGLLRFYPTPALRFADAPAGPTVGMSKVDVTLDGAGKIAGDTGLPLVCNDSTGVVDPNTVWIVEFHLDNLSRDAPRVAWFTLSVTDPDPVRLATILRLDAAPTPAAQYVLASVFAAHVAATLHTGAHGGLDGIVGTAGAAGQVPTSDGAGGAIWGTGGGSGGPPAYTWQEVETADVTLDGTITATSVRPGGADRTVRLPVITADNSGLLQIVTFSGVSEGHTIIVRGQGDDWIDNGLAATVVLRHVGDAVAVVAHYIDNVGDNFWRIVTPPNAGLQIEWIYPSGAGSILNTRLLLFYGDRIENPATGQVTVYLPVALGPHTIGTSPVTIAHGLGYTPVQVDCNLTGPGQIWQSSPADGNNVYLTADAAGRTANVFVR